MRDIQLLRQMHKARSGLYLPLMRPQLGSVQLDALERMGIPRRAALAGSIEATLPNSSVAISAGVGTTIATHLVSSKQYQAMVLADATGTIIGSRDDWFAYFTPTTNALNREVGEIFNASSTNTIRVRGIWVIPTQTSITGANIGFDVNKISAVGTGGTVITPRPADSTQVALNASVTARFSASGGATLAYQLWQLFFFNDETNASTPLQATYNQLPIQGDHPVEIVLHQNEGVQVKQTVSMTTGLTGCLMYFTNE